MPGGEKAPMNTAAEAQAWPPATRLEKVHRWRKGTYDHSGGGPGMASCHQAGKRYTDFQVFGMWKPLLREHSKSPASP